MPPPPPPPDDQATKVKSIPSDVLKKWATYSQNLKMAKKPAGAEQAGLSEHLGAAVAGLDPERPAQPGAGEAGMDAGAALLSRI